MKFENFVSLGVNCSVAASMSKYGLRSWSGVFDWLYTEDFKYVLFHIETNFGSFLKKENLEGWKNSSTKFIDKKSGFIFQHDEFLFLEEYEELLKKYQRRIEIFQQETTNPTCFLRAISNKEEIEYIKKNSKYINSVIKKNNKNNEIVFLVKKDLIVDELPFRFFTMNRILSGSTLESLRNWFDGEWEFLEFCIQNFDAVKMTKNIIFDRQYESRLQKSKEKELKIIGERYNNLLRILEKDWNNDLLPSKIIIYGAGNIGKYFYEKIKEKCKVLAFIDENKSGILIDGVPVMKVNEIIKKNEENTYIVTATYDFQNIYNKLKKIDVDAKILSLEDIL